MHIDSKRFISILLATILPPLSSCSSGQVISSDRRDAIGSSGVCQVNYYDEINGFGCGVTLNPGAGSADDQSIIRMYLQGGRRIYVDRRFEFNPDTLRLIASTLNYLLELECVEGDDPGFPIPSNQVIMESDSLLVSDFDGEVSVTLKAVSFSIVVVGGEGENGFSYKYIIH